MSKGAAEIMGAIIIKDIRPRDNDDLTINDTHYDEV